jgi:DNA-binding beta-propeller fold protein YncE
MNTNFSTADLNRRSFLKKTLFTGAALPLVAPYVRGTDKADAKTPVVGGCAHQYEVIHDWGQIPASHVLGNTHGVCVDSNGQVYVKHTVGQGAQCENAVIVFDGKGKFVRSWGKDFKGGAHGLHLSKEAEGEFLYLCDVNRHLVVKATLSGKEIWTAEFPAQSDLYNYADEYRPTNIAVAPNGTVFVADGYGKNYIHRYDTDGNYLSSFGGTGRGPGSLNCPHGLMVDSRGSTSRLLVADRGNRRLQYFTLEGQHLSFVNDELRAPCHFAERNGVLLIPDLESRVTLFDENNRLIAHLGDGGHYNGIRNRPREFFTPGKFVAPHSACFDNEGNIFVVEWVEVGRITKLQRIS